jgi:hypothetical protein
MCRFQKNSFEIVLKSKKRLYLLEGPKILYVFVGNCVFTSSVQSRVWPLCAAIFVLCTVEVRRLKMLRP